MYSLSAEVPKLCLGIFLEDMLQLKLEIWEPDSQITG